MNKLFLLIFFCGTTLFEQKQDSIISEKINAHIFKPKIVGPTDSRIAQLTLPAGFKIAKFAENLGSPRIIEVSPQGHIYVTTR